jgi:hypothetical protein
MSNDSASPETPKPASGSQRPAARQPAAAAASQAQAVGSGPSAAKPPAAAPAGQAVAQQAAAPAAATKATAPAAPAAAAAPAAVNRAAAPAQSPPQFVIEEEEPGAFVAVLRGFIKASPAWLTSMVVHAAVLLLLALVTIGPPPQKVISELIANTFDENADEIQELPAEELSDVDLSELEPTDMVQQVSVSTTTEQLEVPNNLDNAAVAVQVDLTDFSEVRALKSDLLKQVGALGGTDLSGRGNPAAKKQMVAAGGGNAKSEEAVSLALAWLARQQLPDGGWDFTSPGSAGELKNARNGATAMAILPFLGAGMTHKEGKYKENVRGGLYYLGSHMKQNGSLMDGGTMYSHGIASICLAEAYAMTQDRQLHPPAQAALNFIQTAQDKVGGGWRYSPGQAGDTSAVGWQLMALKSGAMGYLAINPNTIKGAEHFLNSVQTNGGANYGYTGPGAGPATTAVGLLCRMYMGWKKDNPGLEKGIKFLAKAGPSKGNMYFNYYATQVMHHWEGEEWRTWNEKMRDFLVQSQAKDGANKGSWDFGKGDHGSDRGGRIYCTSMACMTLEVYYRHLPIYRKHASEVEFEGP